MGPEAAFDTRYDPGGDVLYILRARAAADRGVEDPQGIVWRYVGGRLVGATVQDFADFWLPRGEALAQELASHFAIPLPAARGLLADAIAAMR